MTCPCGGKSWGRVKSVTGGADPTKTYGVVLDEECTMEAGKLYSCRFRLADSADTSLVLSITNVPGTGTALTFTTPVPITSGPEVGDLAMFGEATRESVDLLVKRIIRGDNLTGQIIMVDEAPDIYDADTGTIPPFDSKINGPTDPAKITPDPPVLIGVESNWGTLKQFGGTGFSRVLVHLSHANTVPKIKSYRVRWRVAGGRGVVYR